MFFLSFLVLASSYVTTDTKKRVLVRFSEENSCLLKWWLRLGKQTGNVVSDWLLWIVWSSISAIQYTSSIVVNLLQSDHATKSRLNVWEILIDWTAYEQHLSKEILMFVDLQNDIFFLCGWLRIRFTIYYTHVLLVTSVISCTLSLRSCYTCNDIHDPWV